jgi:glucan biosynthesis protein C
MLRTAIVAAPVRRSVDALLRATPAALVPLVAALLVSGACVALRAFDKAALSSFADHFIISATLGYFPYFVVGMTAFVYRTLWERMHRIDLAVFGVSIAVLGLLHTPLAGSAPQALQRAAEIFGLSMMRCAIFFALLYLFRRFITIDTKASRMLSDSVYTVYLFHFIVIYAVAVAMGVSGVDTPLVFLSVVLTTFLLTVALHRWVIEPAPLLRFLFNGRGRPLAAAPAAAAGRSQ